MSTVTRSAAMAVREERLWQRHMELAAIGALPKGGVNRQALSGEDAAARALLCRWGEARGFRAFIDDAGNLFLRRAGQDEGLAPVMTGSHLDSQPTGGKFDGAYGVLAGLEVLEALEDAGVRTRRPIEVVNWTNEEGSRFQPGTMGSGAFAGATPLEQMLAVRDTDGVSVAEALVAALAATPSAARRPLGIPVAGYVEAHIEQGPRLIMSGRTIGAVTGIQGSRWFEVEVLGEEAHAGTTPLAARRDALLAAHRMVGALGELMHDPDDVLRFTIGRFQVFPGSPNTVPGRVVFTIDFRHPDDAVIASRGDRVAEVCSRVATPCTARVRQLTRKAAVQFDPEMVACVSRAAERQGLPAMEMLSGAGHDAQHLARLCPSGMIFVPCERGISHNEAESATPADLAAGARVLADVLLELAER